MVAKEQRQRPIPPSVQSPSIAKEQRPTPVTKPPHLSIVQSPSIAKVRSKRQQHLLVQSPSVVANEQQQISSSSPPPRKRNDKKDSNRLISKMMQRLLVINSNSRKGKNRLSSLQEKLDNLTNKNACEVWDRLVGIGRNSVRIQCISKALQGRICQRLHDNNNLEYFEIAKLLNTSEKTIQRSRVCYYVYCKYPTLIPQDAVCPTDFEQTIGHWLKKESNRILFEQQYGNQLAYFETNSKYPLKSSFYGGGLYHIPVEKFLAWM